MSHQLCSSSHVAALLPLANTGPHLQTYGETTVNYNRDIEIFPVLKRMLERILGESPYASPTDMGVNMVGFAITDNDAAIEAQSSSQQFLQPSQL